MRNYGNSIQHASSVTLSATGDAADRYCNKLETQNEGEVTIAVIVILGLVVGFLLIVMGLCLCTAGLASCCCCAREAWCSHSATSCSRGCYIRWGDWLSRFGCGWCDAPPSFPQSLRTSHLTSGAQPCRRLCGVVRCCAVLCRVESSERERKSTLYM
jgi:hypothetical protein